MSSTLTTVKEGVKETLLGTEDQEQLSAHTKATFDSHARKDEVTGELVMGPEEFINAIAPADEDYVSNKFLKYSFRETRVNWLTGTLGYRRK